MMAERVIHPVRSGGRRLVRRREMRLMCIDLTGDLVIDDENNAPTQYEVFDVKESCSIEYNGQQIQLNICQLQDKFSLGFGMYGPVTLVQLEDRLNVSFACKRMYLERTDNGNYLAPIDLNAMRAVDGDSHLNIIRFYGALLDLSEEQLVICMEALERSMDQFYPFLHSQIHPSSDQLDSLIRRLTKHLEISEESHPLAFESTFSIIVQMKNSWESRLLVTLAEDTRELLSRLLRHDVNERPQYYSEILSMPSMIHVTEEPSDNELMIIGAVLNALPPRTSE